jgi:hypothetical protein
LAAWGVVMPRKRYLAEIDEELVQAKKSLAFWRDQALLFPDTQLRDCAEAQVAAYETIIKQIVAVQVQLLSMKDI